MERDSFEPVEVGDLRCVGVINGASCDIDSVCLEGEAVGTTRGLEGERKGEISEGDGRTARLVGEVDAVLLVWDNKSRRGEGWR